MPQYRTFTYTTPTFITEAFCRISYYPSTAAFNNCYSELIPYTALAYLNWISFYDSYQFQGNAHYWYWLQLPYNSFRTCSTNHMQSISYHITLLVINSLWGGHTQIHTHTDVCTEAILRNQVLAGLWLACTWFNNEIMLYKDVMTWLHLYICMYVCKPNM